MKNKSLESMKQEIAADLGISLAQRYNSNARPSGKIGGEMVRRMIKAQEQQMKDQ
ncbi:alpha/beta-type small acid-soluble spore protein [Candidatus Epulonipiscium viviparus]|uniref:alpha/beta-type small acid-soluble spore protein n=1 Tax=Candidatus Epulonipiscium viviparus TaxID=420336 RepID=UPI002738098D|nr:alpha/beta-type small acid-soluble spore protein [Candidatus Epulopiscium viviparus]